MRVLAFVAGMYAAGGRRSVPPAVLSKPTVLTAMYSIRSERAICERLNYDLLFKWFLDMPIDQPAFDATNFTKNRQRLLDHAIAETQRRSPAETPAGRNTAVGWHG